VLSKQAATAAQEFNFWETRDGHSCFFSDDPYNEYTPLKNEAHFQVMQKVFFYAVVYIIHYWTKGKFSNPRRLPLQGMGLCLILANQRFGGG
jgi:hypothetical protein